jgi:hypothetical protein
MGSWWSYEEIAEESIKEKSPDIETKLKTEFNKWDIIHELKTNPNFNDRRARSLAKD